MAALIDIDPAQNRPTFIHTEVDAIANVMLNYKPTGALNRHYGLIDVHAR